MTKNLKFMPYAQATVDITNGETTLISYKTPVACIDRNHILWIVGLYSATTRKHIKAFIAEYVPFDMDFQSIKMLACEPYGLDLDTGELVPATFARLGIEMA